MLDHLRARADRVAEVPLLQPADPFLEVAGEDLRRRIFVTQTVAGTDLCLRPEFTIPVLRDALATGARGRFAVHGTVFRQDRDGHSEFRQAGIEDLGDADAVSADARCVADVLAVLADAGLGGAHVVLGDDALFRALCGSLGLPAPVADRLERAFAEPERLSAVIAAFTGPAPEAHEPPPDVAAIEARVRREMEAAGLPATGGRTAAAIAQRTVERAALRRFRLSHRAEAALRALLSLDVALRDAVPALERLAAAHGVVFGPALATFAARVAAMDAMGLPLAAMRYRGGFGRKLEYYTALQFDVFAPGAARPVAGGGRYDGLARLLGHGEDVSAVGFSIQMDRLAEALS